VPGPHNRRMLRLASSHPPLWRTPSSLQLGVDDAIRLDAVRPWQERLLDALGAGIPDAMLMPLARSFGASDAEVTAFTARIEHALRRDAGARLAVQVEVSDRLSAAERDALDAGWEAAGLDRVAVRTWAADPPQRGIPMIVVVDRILDPRRAARLVQADVTHLPVALAGDRVHVGPLVVPGRTACTACLHTRRSESDPDWPLLAAQLLGREPVRTDNALLVESALLAGRLLRDQLAGIAVDPDDERGRASVSVGLSAGHARREWRAHRPHERCLCRSPGGTATVAAGETPTAPTSSPTASAPHG